MSEISLFDVIGPNMIGPSSSHTAGAVAIALLARKIFSQPINRVRFTLYGSFADTYKGHGTDRALLAGILGMHTDDERIRNAFAIARKKGLDYTFQIDKSQEDLHPNTVDILMENTSGKTMSIRGVSLGGGKVEIIRLNGIKVHITGEYCTLIVVQKDKPGVVAHIIKCLSKYQVNIAYMRIFRESKGGKAYTIVEADEPIPYEILREIEKKTAVKSAMLVEK